MDNKNLTSRIFFFHFSGSSSIAAVPTTSRNTPEPLKSFLHPNSLQPPPSVTEDGYLGKKTFSNFSQSENLRIFLSLRFYVKPILENLEVPKLPF